MFFFSVRSGLVNSASPKFDQDRKWDAPNKSNSASLVYNMLMTRARCVQLYLFWLRRHSSRELSHIAHRNAELIRTIQVVRPSEIFFGWGGCQGYQGSGHGGVITPIKKITAKYKITLITKSKRIVCFRARLPPARFSKKKKGSPSGDISCKHLLYSNSIVPNWVGHFLFSYFNTRKMNSNEIIQLNLWPLSHFVSYWLSIIRFTMMVRLDALHGVEWRASMGKRF